MARIYLRTTNSRGNEVSAAEPGFCHIGGWNAGVRVRVGRRDNRDTFTVEMTSGSYGGETVTLGVVTDTGDGPRWEPASPADEAVRPREPGSIIRIDGEDHRTACGHSFVTCHANRCFRQHDVPDED
jgi:hypothetical protein